jgi:hypothetical protein
VRLTSRTRIAAGIGLSSLIAAAAVAAPAPAAMKKKPTQVTCNLTLFATIKQPAATAANFGSAACGRGFGNGVQQDSSTVKRTSLAAGTFTGPFKMFFDRGTISGTFAIGFVTTLAPATYAITGVMYKGTLKVTDGTGSYRRVRGAGTVVGTSPDAVKTTLVYKLELTGL